MAANKEMKVKKVDVDIDKDINKDVDIDLEAKLELELEKDVDISTSHTKIYAFGIDKDADVTVVKKDIDIDKEIDIEKDVDIDVDVDKDISNWNVDVDVHSNNIIQGSDITEWHDNDVNDIDNQNLINVGPDATLNMDDFTSDQLAIGNSFNGSGNDSQFNVNQSNDLNDDDEVHGTTAHYTNHQKPNVEIELDVKVGVHKGKPPHKDPPKDPKKDHGDKKDGGKGDDWGGGHNAAVFAALHADVEIEAPDDAFQTVEADGGTANSGDGIANAGGSDLSSNNQGSGQITGDSSAAADGVATAEAFTASVLAGGNQQANFATLNVAGGDQGAAAHNGGYTSFGDHGDGGHDDPPEPPKDGDGLAIKDSWITKDFDNDVNDLDTQDLINVSDWSHLTLEDFDLDITAIGNSFNGPGNDMQFSVDQSNDLVDQDNVTGTQVTYNGSGYNGPFQDVSATGGDGTSGNGIGTINPNTGASGNGGDGIIAGSTAASGSALASAEAFTANVVVGANVQVNNFSATVVGGDSAAIIDDIDA